MDEPLKDLIRRLSKEQSFLHCSEQATKQGLIQPLLNKLGWNVFDVQQEVIPEFQVEGGRVDYCLKVNAKPMLFIEAKRANEDLIPHERQLLEYAFKHGVD